MVSKIYFGPKKLSNVDCVNLYSSGSYVICLYSLWKQLFSQDVESFIASEFTYLAFPLLSSTFPPTSSFSPFLLVYRRLQVALAGPLPISHVSHSPCSQVPHFDGKHSLKKYGMPTCT